MPVATTSRRARWRRRPKGCHAFVQAGDVVRVRLPSTEVCMHMRVAGKAMNVQIVTDGISVAAQLLRDDGSPFSTPITLGEAGILTDEAGRLYVPNRRLVLTE